MQTRTERSEYKGHDMLSIVETDIDKYPTKLSFGKKKAQMILSQIEAIKAFAQETDIRVPPVITGIPLPPGENKNETFK